MTFTRRDLFWYCAGVLTVAVIALLVHALNGAQHSTQASLGMHGESLPSPSNPPPADTGPAAAAPNGRAAGSMDEMLTRLEARLAAQGGSDSDWELLAQTYEFVGRTDDAKLARSHQLPPSATTSASPSVSPATDESTAAAGPAAISGHVDVAAALKSKVPDGWTLFIVAKDVDSPGPPVAILRTTTGHWPLAFTLNDSNAMMPGRALSSARRVTIEARASRSGMATPQAGDYQSSIATLDAHQATAVRILIDHVIG
jgi:cytochrome c-type biogenesis protein CcmH